MMLLIVVTVVVVVVAVGRCGEVVLFEVLKCTKGEDIGKWTD